MNITERIDSLINVAPNKRSAVNFSKLYYLELVINEKEKFAFEHWWGLNKCSIKAWKQLLFTKGDGHILYLAKFQNVGEVAEITIFSSQQLRIKLFILTQLTKKSIADLADWWPSSHTKVHHKHEKTALGPALSIPATNQISAFWHMNHSEAISKVLKSYYVLTCITHLVSIKDSFFHQVPCGKPCLFVVKNSVHKFLSY